MFKLTKREIKKINTHYKGGMININLEVLKKLSYQYTEGSYHITSTIFT
jgi:hypothetical protein